MKNVNSYGVKSIFGMCMHEWGMAWKVSISKGKYEGARDGSCRRKFAVEDA